MTKQEVDRPCDEALATMRERGGEWYVYRNKELGHHEMGHMKFLQCGEGRTFSTPPRRLPDTRTEINWRYWLTGKVNLETGEVEPMPLPPVPPYAEGKKGGER